MASHSFQKEILFSDALESLAVCCLHLYYEFRLCARGHHWCGIIHPYLKSVSFNKTAIDDILSILRYFPFME